MMEALSCLLTRDCFRIFSKIVYCFLKSEIEIWYKDNAELCCDGQIYLYVCIHTYRVAHTSWTCRYQGSSPGRGS